MPRLSIVCSATSTTAADRGAAIAVSLEDSRGSQHSMALAAGTHVGPYAVVSSLGAGGMGEVYRARDSRLKREVALKILPASFAGDPDRLARFQREAEVPAALNHPLIAAIYGLEDAPGGDGSPVRALVLELVEGETLADRIARGPVPTGEAVPIARQIAEALEAAHEHGIIHRDLKPANIKRSRPTASSRCSTSAWRSCTTRTRTSRTIRT